jgi:hypothetical protein
VLIHAACSCRHQGRRQHNRVRGSSKAAGADAEARQPSASQTSVLGEGGAHAGRATLPMAGVEPAALSARASPKSAAVRKDSSPALVERELNSSVSEVGDVPAAELAAAVVQIVQVCACTPETATLALTATVDKESAIDLILTGFFNDEAASEVGGISPPETTRVLMTSSQYLSMTGFVMSGCQKGCTAPEGCSAPTGCNSANGDKLFFEPRSQVRLAVQELWRSTGGDCTFDEAKRVRDFARAQCVADAH